MTTTLALSSGIQVVSYAARGLTQTLGSIDEGKNMRRTINGDLRHVSAPQFKKFASEVACTDQAAPSWVWAGQVLTVDCAVILSYGSGGAPVRPVVSGSSYTENGFTFYRPQMTMMVTDFSIDYDEWGAETGWSLSLSEV